MSGESLYSDIESFDELLKDSKDIFNGQSNALGDVTILALVEKLNLVLLSFDELKESLDKKIKYRIRSSILCMIWILEDYIQDHSYIDLKLNFIPYYEKFNRNISDLQVDEDES